MNEKEIPNQDFDEALAIIEEIFKIHSKKNITCKKSERCLHLARQKQEANTH